MNFKINESEQKLRGGYYTPQDLAVYLSKWISEINPSSVLEPSCGDGVFLETLELTAPKNTKVTAIELNETEASKAKDRTENFTNISSEIISTDFLEWSLSSLNKDTVFDAIVGNPPFIRYQYLPDEAQLFSKRIFDRFHLPFTKHTNAWVPFVIASLALLKPGGRLAMVLPAEILHVLHAQSLRYFLGQHCKRIIVIDPEEIWFDGTLQGAVLFLAEKKHAVKEHTIGLGIIPTVGKSFLENSPSKYFDRTNFINGKTVEGKWTRALLTKNELDIFDEISSHKEVHKFSNIANVDVGLVTGANKFFLVSDDVVKKYNLEEWSHPMFGRSQHCRGVLYDEKQHKENTEQGLPSNFIWFNVNDESELPQNALDYIYEGEAENLHTRYKCRVRKPWFKVPSVYSTSIGMLKRAHDIPRLIFNDIEAYTTDTAYRITTNQCEPKKLVYNFINSFTALSSELEGRHYGGGVLELVPSEIEKVLIPLPDKARTEIKRLDDLIRNNSAQDILDIQDSKILKGLGLSENEIATVNGAWSKLRHRRQRSTSKANL